MGEENSQITIIGPIHVLSPTSPNCQKCGAPPEKQEVKNYNMAMQDGDVYCTVCGAFVRYYDAG